MRQILLLPALLIALSALLGTGCRNEQTPASSAAHLRVAFGTYVGSALLILAQEQGYFRDENLTVELHPFSSGHLALEAVLTNKADLATATETPLAQATLCEVDRSMLIVAQKESGIQSVGDLRGKTIGVVPGTAADFFLHTLLTVSLIDLREVRIVPLETDEIVPALLESRVDAVSTWSPFNFTLLDALGADAAVLTDDNLYTLSWNLVAARDLYDRHPEQVQRFLHALARAHRFMVVHSAAEVRTIVTPFIDTPSSVLDRTWSDFRFGVHLDQSLILDLEDQARWMHQKGGREDQPLPNFLNWIESRPLKAVEPEAVRIIGR